MPKEYVQDRMRDQKNDIVDLIQNEKTYIYVCGLRDMETGVDEAFNDICRGIDVNWLDLKEKLRSSGRYHVETY
jgi:benzoyl-CoA 2,3-dioxygenase component A